MAPRGYCSPMRRPGRCSALGVGLPSKAATFTAPQLGRSSRIYRLLRAQGPRAKWSRRRNFDLSRLAQFTPACDGDAVRSKGAVAELPWLGLEHSRGHYHRRRFGQGKMDRLSGHTSIAGQRVQVAHDGFLPLIKHMGIDLRR